MAQADIPFEIFRRALDLHPRLSQVRLQGEGEPLLHPRFFEMVQYCNERKLRVSTITNGSQFTSSNIEKILEVEIEHILISIESSVPETFFKVRNGNLGIVLHGIRHLLELRNQRALAAPLVGFAVTLLKSTARNIGDIIELYDELRLDGGLSIQPLQRMPYFAKHYSNHMIAEQMSEREVKSAVLPYILDLEKRNSKVASTQFGGRSLSDWHSSSKTCPWIEQGAYLSVDGHLTACCAIKESKRYSLGPGIRERMRRDFESGIEPESCRGCWRAEVILQNVHEQKPTQI